MQEAALHQGIHQSRGVTVFVKKIWELMNAHWPVLMKIIFLIKTMETHNLAYYGYDWGIIFSYFGGTGNRAQSGLPG